MNERKVKVNILTRLESGDKWVMCPVISKSSDYDWCTTTCAWFNVSIGKTGKKNERNEDIYADYAYCKDHCIGEIIP